MKLFGYLPETLFQPLAGPKKHVYARLLLRLHERVFSARVLDKTTKEEILTHIANALPEAGIATGDELQEDGVPPDTQPHAHYIAYNRLRDTGWLMEEKQRWDVLVEMHPDAFMLLGEIANLTNNRVRVAGAVVEVKSSLEAAARDPDQLGQGLANACDTATRFARSMRRILASMRDIESSILGNPDAGAILRTFFRDFVDGLLIADYKQLKTSNNPYRYRRQISTLAGELFYDIERRGKLARAYIEQGVMPPGSTLAEAEARIVTELDTIRQVFEDVAPFMERIEEFRERLERRVRMTVHYMDVMGAGSAERIARLIERLAATNKLEVELVLRTPDAGFPITEKALYMPPPPRGAPEKTRFKMPKRDPYLRAYVAATTEFDKLVRVTPSRMTAFIDAKIEGREKIHSSEIGVETIEELLVFRALPAELATSERARIGPYVVTIDDGRTQNEWIDVPSFHVERVAGHAS